MRSPCWRQVLYKINPVRVYSSSTLPLYQTCGHYYLYHKCMSNLLMLCRVRTSTSKFLSIKLDVNMR